MSKVIKKAGWSDIKIALGHCSENDLKGVINELYKLNKENKAFLEAKFLNSADIIDEYKKKIKKYLAPNEPWKESQRISLRDAKKQLTSYRPIRNIAVKKSYRILYE